MTLTESDSGVIFASIKLQIISLDAAKRELFTLRNGRWFNRWTARIPQLTMSKFDLTTRKD